jgi:hypothetical protein
MDYKTNMENKEIMGVLSCMAYGYQVKVSINGVDVGIEGGKSENRRFFNVGHPMMGEAPPEKRASIFVLKPGENSISIEFTKTGDENDNLSITLDVEGYPSSVLSVTSRNLPSKKIEKTFNLTDTVPADFQSITITDESAV